MNDAILKRFQDYNERLARLETLEQPATAVPHGQIKLVGVAGSDYGILKITDDATTLLNSGLPSDGVAISIAAHPTNLDKWAILINYAAYPYPQFATEGGFVIRGNGLTYPTTGGPCVYVTTDGATFTAVNLPTSHGDSWGRVCIGINNIEWNGDELVIAGAVIYRFAGVFTATVNLWRWTSGANATVQFETASTASTPLLAIIGQDGDVVSLEMEETTSFDAPAAHIVYATDGATDYSIQTTGAAGDFFGGGDTLPESRTIIAAIIGGDVVRLIDYRTAATPDVIGNVAIHAAIAPGSFVYYYAPGGWLTVAQHGGYYIDASGHVQKITNPGGSATTAQVDVAQIPNASVIDTVRAARQQRITVAAVSIADSELFWTDDGDTWQSTVLPYTLSGAIEMIDTGDAGGSYPAVHALSGDRHTGSLVDSQHGSLSGGSLHDLATGTIAGFMSSADFTKLATIAAGASVSSVALSAAAEFSVAGSPITSSGTIVLSWANQTQNKVFASPIGSTGVPSFRALVAADIPSLAYVTSVALTAPAEINVAGSPVTSAGTLALTWATQTANKVFASAVSGGVAAPAFRVLVAADLPPGIGPGQSANVIIVNADGSGDYTTLSAALAAITTASSSNRFLIQVYGPVAETAQVVAKNYIDVRFMKGAVLTATIASTVSGVYLNTLTDCMWSAEDQSWPCIVRAGVPGASTGTYALEVRNGGADVRLENIYAKNTTTGSANCYGIGATQTTTSKFFRCTGEGSGSSTGGLGFQFTNTSSVIADQCIGIGGNGTGSCYGFYITSGASGVFYRCRGSSGTSGNGSHGFAVDSTATAAINVVDCEGWSLSNGTSCYGLAQSGAGNVSVYGGRFFGGGAGGGYGIYIDVYSQAKFIGVYAHGGNALTSCVGVTISGGSAPILTNCTIIGGAGGASCYGAIVQTNARPKFINCIIFGGGVGTNARTTVSYTAANNGRFQPSATKPYRLVGVVKVIVSVATAGATVQFGSTVAGTDLTAAQSLAATGTFYLPVTGNVLIAAAAYLYATTTGAPADASFTVTYDVEWSELNSQAVWLDSGYAEFRGCTIQSNAASDAVNVTALGIVGSSFYGCSIIAGKRDAGRKKSVNAAVAWNPAPIYLCVLDGGQTNVTCAAGTANGTSTEI